MKKFIETLKNIWHVEDLRNRLLITLAFAAMYRFGSFIVLPGINPEALTALKEQTDAGLMSLLNMFSGGAFSNASIFALGIMPYISASIVMQLLAVAVPYVQKMQREGESGRKKISMYTRWLTVAILLFQAPGYLMNLKMQAGAALATGISWSVFMVPAVIILSAGSMFILWLGERITDKGIGNGISLIIMIGIIARLPQAFIQEVSSRFTAITGGGLVMFLVEIIILYAVVCASIVLVTGVRKIPVQYAKRLVGNKQYGGARQYIPLKLFAANVMPIIFAGPILSIPGMLLTKITNPKLLWLNNIGQTLVNGTSWAYIILFSLLVLFFSFFWVATQFNAVRIADDLKRTGGYVPGIRPGRATAEFLDHTMSRVTLIGAIGLIIVAIFPNLLNAHLELPWEMASFFGGTSLLIIVGVALDTLRQMESYLTMRHYDGFLKHGRIQARR